LNQFKEISQQDFGL